MRVLSKEEMGDVAGGWFWCWWGYRSSCTKTTYTCEPKKTYTCEPKPECDPKPSCDPTPSCDPAPEEPPMVP